MITGIYQSAAILGALILFYTVDFWLIHRYDPLRACGSSRSWSYTIKAWLAAAAVIAQPVVCPWLGLRVDAWWGLLVQGMGVVLIVGALALHWWARVHLGQFYGEREEVQPGQHLIESGPYARMRHPIYTSYFALAAGLVLTVPALTTMAGAIYAFVDFSLAARREERLLSSDLPGYEEYKKRTGRFLPEFRAES